MMIIVYHSIIHIFTLILITNPIILYDYNCISILTPYVTYVFNICNCYTLNAWTICYNITYYK